MENYGQLRQRFKMKTAAKFQIVFVTAPNRKVARQLARAALEARVAACANLVPGIESHYWWNGRIESGAEILVIFKTVKTKVRALEKVVLAHHPYDTPEFVALELAGGNRRYLQWLEASTRPA
jgi:periplasmic divalent cation tolerance protein